jgi:hypothetical protein
MEKEAKIIEQLKTELTFTSEPKLLKTLEKVKGKGNDQMVEPILNLYSTTKHDSVKKVIKGLLNELKVIDGTTILIERLKNCDNELKEVILGALWSAGLNPIEYLPEIVEAACSSSYMVAFEALTILENLEGPFDEEKISESKLIINDYFAKPNEETKQLISVILGLLNEMDNSLDA